MSEKANEVRETLHVTLGDHMYDLLCDLPTTCVTPRSHLVKTALGAEVARLMHWAVHHATSKLVGDNRASFFAEVARGVPLTLPPEGWSHYD